ncbi:TetR/AcrR family transcriptional regulator [Methylobacterium sp. Leaf456]|uniref:TetR/AcrR family transcriptional regulator n=1 Tax=Methylobacterium sp. Leaf456 TaxID=1736382 RepID=UPI000B12208A|nr:TetR/AcrR family transcriptional regulator [Methylobacterium sp. Leaf456]
MSTSRPAKAGYHHGELREALVAAGLAILEEGGDPASLGLREAARRAGVSAMAPYRHFSDKDALLAAVATVGFERLRADLAAADGSVSPPPCGEEPEVVPSEPPPPRTPPDKGEGTRARSDVHHAAEMDESDKGQAALVAQGVAYVTFAAANPGLFRLMFKSCSAAPPEALAKASGDAFVVLAARVAALVPAEHAADEALRCWALVHGMAVLALDGSFGAGLRGNVPAVVALAERLLALDARRR